MKIDKKNFRHWGYLFVFTFNVLTSLLVLIFSGKVKNRIVLYGHKLYGNLAAIYDYDLEKTSFDFKVYFLCLDPGYYRELNAGGVRVLSALKWRDVLAACRAEIIVTDHGPHSLFFLNIFTSTIFVDVWHGIPFKYFDSDDFYYVKKYTAIFVPSEKIRELYVQCFSIPDYKIHVTGYGRTDRLISGRFEKQRLLQDYGLPSDCKKYILYAPTWYHERGEKSLANLGVGEKEFLLTLTQICASLNVCLILRTHINTVFRYANTDKYVFLPGDQFPKTEEILAISDVLISDWSSIVFDFLLLMRPTIFVDTRVPFKNGFSLGPQYRVGHIVTDLKALDGAIRMAIENPEAYLHKYRSRMEECIEDIYGKYVDGRSSERYFEEIDSLVSGSSELVN